jgi:hypothetical protein
MDAGSGGNGEQAGFSEEVKSAAKTLLSWYRAKHLAVRVDAARERVSPAASRQRALMMTMTTMTLTTTTTTMPHEKVGKFQAAQGERKPTQHESELAAEAFPPAFTAICGHDHQSCSSEAPRGKRRSTQALCV